MKFLYKIILILPLLLLSCKESDTHQIELLESEIERLKTQNDSLIKSFKTRQPDSNYWFNTFYEGRKFIQQGIENPTEFIENALRENPELIPLDGVLGGTMYFGKIQLLSDKWLIAEFEDGHIYGKAIFSYSINKEGIPEFKLLESTGLEE